MRTDHRGSFVCAEGPEVWTKNWWRAYQWQGGHANADAGFMDANRLDCREYGQTTVCTDAEECWGVTAGEKRYGKGVEPAAGVGSHEGVINLSG